MNRSRLLLIGILALTLGALVAFKVYRSLQAKIIPATVGVDVLEAANNIAVGTKLEDHDLKVVKLPSEVLRSSRWSDASTGTFCKIVVLRGSCKPATLTVAVNAARRHFDSRRPKASRKRWRGFRIRFAGRALSSSVPDWGVNLRGRAVKLI